MSEHDLQNNKQNPLRDIGTLFVMILLSILGAIIGVQLITTLGVTPNTSIIGALFAMLLARIPMQAFQRSAPYTRRIWPKR